MRTTEKLQPWGCDQQGRYPTRSNSLYDDWAAEEPHSWGDLLIVVWIIGVIAAIVSLGPWL